ncbi:MAG: tetratricopeptide repeat protein [Pikeienuella sp.]
MTCGRIRTAIKAAPIVPLCMFAVACQAPIAPQQVVSGDQVKLGVELLRAGQPAMALDAFNRAIAEKGPTVIALTGAGAAYHQTGDFGSAEKLLRAAIRQDPNFAPARNNLGVILFETGRTKQARQEFERAYALSDGDQNRVSVNLGIAEMALQQDEGATAVPPEPEFDLMPAGSGLYQLGRQKEDGS